MACSPSVSGILAEKGATSVPAGWIANEENACFCSTIPRQRHRSREPDDRLRDGPGMLLARDFWRATFGFALPRVPESQGRYADFARRANLSRSAAIDLTPKSVASFRLSRFHKRGGSRSSRTLGMGCDGRTSPSAMIARTNGGCADGEVVWSWRSDAGAKLVETIPLMTVATKHGHRGDHEGHR